jgi:DeoR family glycerol-3-phosphate regulon repressor
MANSRRVFLVADHTKFGRSAMTRIGHISEVDAIFTDARPSDDFMARIEEAGVSLYIASQEQDLFDPITSFNMMSQSRSE